MHFSDERWSDFVRSTVGEDARVPMQAHLQSGCAECAATVATLETVMRLATADLAHPVPLTSVEQARAIFEARAARSWLDSLEVIRATLAPGFEWRLAGVRSGGSVATAEGSRMLYRAGDYSIDLKLDAPAGGESAEIVGQISCEASPLESVHGVLVQMVSARGRTLGETTTNEFGEFFVDYAGGKNVTLRFALRPRNQRIDVPLKMNRRITSREEDRS